MPDLERARILPEAVDIPIFLGGQLSRIPEDSLSSLPIDVRGELQAMGVFACQRVEDMLCELVSMANRRQP